MKHIFRFLSRSKLAVVIILCLLMFQAYCDLELPNLTSDLLNYGLQQGGIEDAVPNTVSADSLRLLELFMEDPDISVAEASYGAADHAGIRALTKGADRAALEQILLIPECIAAQLNSGAMQYGDTILSADSILSAVDAGLISREDISGHLASARAEMERMTDTYLKQAAVYFVSAEYESQGLDLNSIRSTYLLKIGARMLLMTCLMAAAAVGTGFVASRVSANIGRTLRRQIYEKVMSFSGAEMEQFSTASLITRSTNDIQQVQMLIVLLLRMVLYAPILAIGGILNVVRVNLGMSWIILLAVVLLLACVGILIGIAMPKFKRMQLLVDRLNLVSREMLTGIMPVRAFSREQHEEERFEEANRALFQTQLFTNRAMVFMMPVMMFIMNGLSILIVWVGGHQIDAGMLQIGDLTAFITYSMVIVMGFLILSMIAVFLPRASVAAERIMEVINTPVVLQDPEHPRDEELQNARGKLEFRDVSFRYPGAEGYALSHISFTAEPGKMTAIIGSTGCGKTTLVRLIPRFFDVTEGSILLDDIDIRDISQKKLRSLLGYVPQKGQLFSGTIESNLKFAGSSVSDDDMRHAAETAQAVDFISAKPDGYSSSIAQEGSNVSGGQRQRLSIARAIAKHPKVYLFDDSFSALDYKTDLALRRALAAQKEKTSMIVVAQRISTILHADSIIVLNDGQIDGIGTHEELLRTSATYQEIARSQLSEAELADAMKGGCR